MTLSTFDRRSVHASTEVAWTERASRLHTTSPDQAQAWRDHGLDVDQVTDAAAIAVAKTDPSVVWV